MKITMFLVALIPVYCSAAAAPKNISLCKSKELIDASASSCNDNPAYAEAAVECLEQLQKLVKSSAEKAALEMAAANATNVSNSVNKQTNTFKGTSDVNNISVNTSNQLLNSARQAIAQVEAYQGEMFLPDDTGFLDGGGPEAAAFLSGQNCYTDTDEVLAMVLEDMDKIVDDLTKALGKSAELKENADGKKKAVKGLSGSDVLRKNKAAVKNKGAGGRDETGLNLQGSAISDSRAKLNPASSTGAVSDIPKLGEEIKRQPPIKKDEKGDKPWMDELLNENK